MAKAFKIGLALIAIVYISSVGFADSDYIAYFPFDHMGQDAPLSLVDGFVMDAALNNPALNNYDHGIRGTALDFYEGNTTFSFSLAKGALSAKDGITLNFFVYFRDMEPHTYVLDSSFIAFMLDPQTSDKANLVIKYSNGQKDTYDIDYSFTPRKWYMLTITFGADRIRFYVNGTLMLDDIFWRKDLATDDKGRFPFVLAGTMAPGRGSRFNGMIDELFISGRCWPQEDILDMTKRYIKQLD